MVRQLWQMVCSTLQKLGLYRAHLKIPEFPKGKSQVIATEIERIYFVANVCIHVEHVIGLLLQKQYFKYYLLICCYNKTRRKYHKLEKNSHSLCFDKYATAESRGYLNSLVF